jgi:hypothetical protein
MWAGVGERGSGKSVLLALSGADRDATATLRDDRFAVRRALAGAAVGGCPDEQVRPARRRRRAVALRRAPVGRSDRF